MSLLCRGRGNGILTFVTKTVLILCQGEGRWGLCTAEVDRDDDMTLAIVHSFQDYLTQRLDESTSDNDDEHDHSSEGFFLQCGAVPASIMPASDPLSAPFALAGQHTQLLTLHWTICTEFNGQKYLHQYSTICAEQCTAQFALHRNICTTIIHCKKSVSQKMDRLEKGHTWKCDGQPSIFKWDVLTVHIGGLYKLFTIWLQCGSKTCSALADSFKLFQCSWWMEVPTLLRHSSFIILIILQRPYSLSP